MEGLTKLVYIDAAKSLRLTRAFDLKNVFSQPYYVAYVALRIKTKFPKSCL